MLKFGHIYGDITLLAKSGYLVHGVNCCNVMGSGVAKAIFTIYPSVKSSYHSLATHNLGDVQYVKVTDSLTVVNAHTQFNYGYDGKRYVSYDAIATCFDTLANHVEDGATIWIPKIGSDLGGGDFDAILAIIKASLRNRNVNLILVIKP
jgi:O-acetyl-ADP-ribose deacetylase (regulator of RNase III)